MKVGNEQRQIRRFGVFLMHRGLCGDVIDETQKTAICRLVQIQEESEYTTVEAQAKEVLVNVQ